ncbi:uncharacterized protein LOC110109244 [Dendrobium catenatum]|uniref:uncharacterized protein LOC110109244 n=1 Tax=Dendrobium catenatum TaxID=906689 RepID=UPI0010A05AC5|nr:uncharacterized protein LOC110109244 [Dendrobium catenatum]
MEDFNDMISNGNLIDIGFTGNNFTWHRGHLWQRLDRVLFNDDWLNVFHLTKVEHLSRTLSDHSPILINIKNDCTAPISHFRFQNMWLLHPTFLDVVKVNWEAPVFPDDTISGMHRLWLKLKRLKIVLKCWNHNVFKNLFANISSVESKVNSLDSLFQSDPTEVNFALLNEAKVDLCMFQDQEEFWKQKAAVKHLVDGDRNTKYFHALVKKRRSSNFIHKIAKEDGTMSEDYGEIFSLAVNFFQSHLNKTFTPISSPNPAFIPHLVSSEDNALLSIPPSFEELKVVLFGIDSNFVAGPDGYTSNFFRKTWHIISGD